MTGRKFLALFAAVTIAACSSDSRNPQNRNQAEAEVQGFWDPLVRSLVPQILTLDLEPTAGGAIIHATGLSLRQGYHDSELVPVGEEIPNDGVLNYEFRVTSPPKPTPTGTPTSREILAGRFVSKSKLVGVTKVRVISAANALSIRP